jgi:hypothetical protein
LSFDLAEMLGVQPAVKKYTVSTYWTQREALDLVKKIEGFAPNYGYHVGLTGGVLYKEGERKDIDVIFYPHNGPDNVVNPQGLTDALLNNMGIVIVSEHCGWLKKAKYLMKNLDLFFMTRIVGNNKGREYPDNGRGLE